VEERSRLWRNNGSHIQGKGGEDKDAGHAQHVKLQGKLNSSLGRPFHVLSALLYVRDVELIS
jgi:hypothetical protein